MEDYSRTVEEFESRFSKEENCWAGRINSLCHRDPRFDGGNRSASAGFGHEKPVLHRRSY
jgi:hypothetical protein